MGRVLDLEAEAQRPAQPPRQSPPQQRVRRKPRDPDECEALIRLVDAQWSLYLSSGQLEVLGPRSYRLHLGQEKVIEYLREQGRL